MDLSAPSLTEKLAAHRARRMMRLFAPRRAAVALILRWPRGRGGAEVLLVQRAPHPGDRWSGHVALPGGREEPHDVDLVETARRETREEVALDIARGAELVGRLDARRAVARGRYLPMSITPFVFRAFEGGDALPPPAPGPEIAEAFWFPLERAASGELDDIYPFRLGPLTLRLGCWRYEQRTIWGLTYDILRELLALASGERARHTTLRELLRARR
ncbi:MAG: CoA pyrophosphatase [Myxococcales bacterium]|nr:CoA pyrophosphatase [Myxococcales bacterium]